MKKVSSLLLLAFVVAGCHRGTDVVVCNDGFNTYDVANVEITVPTQLNDAPATRIDADLERDVVVETEHHIIHMVGNPGTQYKYYVWTGDNNTNSEPDVIVDRGTVTVPSDK